MKTTRYQKTEAATVLTGMITSDKVLSRIHAHMKGERNPFGDKWSDTVARWCLDYFGKYQKAPGKTIQALFDDYAKTAKDESTVALIEKMLAGLSDDYTTEVNTDYVVDLSVRHFSKVRLENFSSQLEADLAKDDVASAHQHLVEYKPVRFASSDVQNVFTDKAGCYRAFQEREDNVLIRYPGALGEFFGRDLERDALVAILAPDKRGKSTWLIDAGWRAAVRNRRRVIYFSVGDLSRDQVWYRLGQRAAYHPAWPCSVDFPRNIARNGDDEFQLKTERKVFDNGLDAPTAWKGFQEAYKKTGAHQSNFQFECYPTATLTVAEIDLKIQERVYGGWIPDLILIDYADILAPEPGTAGFEQRHIEDARWMAMRTLGTKYKNLVMTATQSNKESYTARILHRKHITEDKRKLAHVSAMFGVNEWEENNGRGIQSLNWIVRRNDAYDDKKLVHVAGSMAVANPCMISCW